MTDQLQLLDVAPAKPARQTQTAWALDRIRDAGENGLHPDELGALLHERDGKHDAGDRCEWCARDGARVLRRLDRARKVTRRHGNAAVLLDDTAGAAPQRARPDAFGEFPKGY